MKSSLSTSELETYIRNQVEHFFPDGHHFSVRGGVLSNALERLEECLSVVSLPGYHDNNGNTCFSHLHADQYATFIYFLANEMWQQNENKENCDKLLQLNRVLHQIFISYKCNLPEHFLLIHPIGTILGNAIYDDYLVALQGVTVNTGEEWNTPPKLGRGVYLGSNSRVIGYPMIGNYSSIGVDSLVYNTDVPENSIVINVDGKSIVRKRKHEQCFAQKFFNVKL